MFQKRKTRGQKEGTELETLLGQDEETEPSFQYGATFYEASSSKFTHSANPNEECRFILLGGDEGANKDVCRIIFRNQRNQQRTELEDWELQENHVHGRHVTVAISPPTWLEHLRSYIFLSRGIRSIKNDIEKCVSVAFPGPNAFLLVIRDGRDNGKEHFLLEAVASVFGKQALDYSMVLLIRGSGQNRSDPPSMKCVKKCGQRLHVLEDTDSSVQELFSKVLRMISDNKRKFFIPPAYEKFMETEFESWETRRISKMNTFLAKCQDEKDNLIGELRNDLDASKVREDQLRMELNTSQQSENKLRNKMKDYESESSKLRKDSDPSMSELQKELDVSKKSESDLQKELDASKSSNYELRRNCEILQIRERELQKKLDVSKKSETELQKDLCASKKSESELQKNLEASQLRETKLIKELDDFRRNECNTGRLLDSAQQRESEVNKEDCGVKKDNTEQEPQASGTRNRRGSKDLEVPNFSTEQTHYFLGTM
ncbi:polyamine-modulated factor 1-binding protein 1-like isoform X1 [Tachysurus fulvidraco]|uniref:polyamine-modulated factor 1-binding protein 1-like isoform X1 n=1 Tax=Tachysurus fulvidraco TaxID=1234273 RepID=UPI001FEED62A|nr:polyamine-modulated factor 1-binding protein 1-like isoform X1 [Tachysurus fulvidraco]